MTPEELQQFNDLKKEVLELKALILKDNFSDLQIFRKKLQFLNKSLNIKNIPTASAGLATGDLWSDSGTIKIV